MVSTTKTSAATCSVTTFSAHFCFVATNRRVLPAPIPLGLPAAAPRALPSPIGLGAPGGGDGPALILRSRGRSLAAYELVVQRDCRGHLVVVDRAGGVS
jgi:hypothetical protein